MSIFNSDFNMSFFIHEGSCFYTYVIPSHWFKLPDQFKGECGWRESRMEMSITLIGLSSRERLAYHMLCSMVEAAKFDGIMFYKQMSSIEEFIATMLNPDGLPTMLHVPMYNGGHYSFAVRYVHDGVKPNELKLRIDIL